MQRILGVDADTYMHLVKPMFGDPMAPRFWNDKLVHELKRVGMRQHPLDKCIWYTVDASGKLDAILGVHVDDLIGAMKADGEMVMACEQLAMKLKFGSWKQGPDLVFTGCEVKTVDGEVHMKQAAYMSKILPITVGKQRKTEPNEPLTPSEHTRLTALMVRHGLGQNVF